MSDDFTLSFPSLINSGDVPLVATFANASSSRDPALLVITHAGSDWVVSEWTETSTSPYTYTAKISVPNVGTGLTFSVAYDGGTPQQITFDRKDPNIALHVEGVDITDPTDLIITNDNHADVTIVVSDFQNPVTDASEFTIHCGNIGSGPDESTFAKCEVGPISSHARDPDTWEVDLTARSIDDGLAGRFLVSVAVGDIRAFFNLLSVNASLEIIDEQADVVVDGAVSFSVRPINIGTRYDASNITVTSTEGAIVPTLTPDSGNNKTTVSYTSTVRGDHTITVIVDNIGSTRTTVDYSFKFAELEEESITFDNGIYTITLRAHETPKDYSTSNISVTVTPTAIAGIIGTVSKVEDDDGNDDTFSFTYQPLRPGIQTIKVVVATDGDPAGWTKEIVYWPEDDVVSRFDNRFNPKRAFVNQLVQADQSLPVSGPFEAVDMYITLGKALTTNDSISIQLSMSPIDDIQSGTATWATYKVFDSTALGTTTNIIERVNVYTEHVRVISNYNVSNNVFTDAHKFHVIAIGKLAH